MASPVTPDAVRAAYSMISRHLRRTPLFAPPRGAFGVDADVTLKLELFQHAGSFKPRGAFFNLASRKIPQAGVAAASGGNHGAAVAYAAQQFGVKARIFVPEISSPAKVAAIRRFGAEAVIGGARYYDALDSCLDYIAQSGAMQVSAFDSIETISGQGTVALEWEEQSGAPDTVLIAVGGGGLISGVASFWGKRVKIVGVEPEGSRALHAALAAGRDVDVDVNSVAADSLGAKTVGPLVYSVCAPVVDHVALVSDDAIVDAQRTLWRDFRIASEPGGATALAALLSGAFKPKPGEKVGVLVCGGNVDLTKLAEIAS
ncbi:MAG: threonine dehydratase [Rhizobiales bacterium 65-9]|nr:threonine/serine dehydratase [Hyphomicrobiales bacterium]OJY36562.1 MAG: threonine dehydratase [Rhizobiales bacterium 65-9]